MVSTLSRPGKQLAKDIGHGAFPRDRLVGRHRFRRCELFAFDSQDGAGDNSATRYSWLTDNGTDVQAVGSGITFAGEQPTSGTITSLSFDTAADGGFPDYQISGTAALSETDFLIV